MTDPDGPTRPVVPQPYRPVHHARPNDTVDLTNRLPRAEPPSWLLSGPLLAAGVLLLLVVAAWLAYQYARVQLR
jgi:hypothetical protein